MDLYTGTRLMIVAPNTKFVRLFLAEQIRLLVRKDFDVQLVCAADHLGGDTLADLPCVVRFANIAREISVAKDFAALAKLLALLGHLKPDILHVHGPKPSLLASVAGVLRGVPVRLHTIHGLRSEGLRGMRRTIVRTMERLTFACSTRCFAVSRSLADHVVEAKLAAPQKVAVLGWGSWAGIDLQRFQPGQWTGEAAALRERWNISADALVVTYIGRLAADKGLQTLAEAWQSSRLHFPQARLLIVGPPDSTDPLDAATLLSLRSDPTVILEERFANDVPALLAASNVFVQPSLREGLGVAALEAAAMELPVIASRVTGLVDTVQGRTSGLLVTPQDAPALADAIEYLLDYPDTRQEFGRMGRRLVQERFAQADVLQASLQMYTDLAQATCESGVWNKFGKRLFDLIVALSLLLVASPLMLLVAVAIWIFLSRPVLFTQERGGLHGKPIRIFKFRTMKMPGPGQAMIGTDDDRAHWLGLLLRKLSLDELPQLFNVVRGEMSLIGPRPLLLTYLPRYTEQQRHRHDTLPGITGLAQVSGRNSVSWAQRFELDLWYVRHRNAWLDLTILFLTLKRLFRPRDIAATGSTAMPEFLGDTHQAHS